MELIQQTISSKLAAEHASSFDAAATAKETLLSSAIEYWLTVYNHRQFSADTRKNYRATMKLFLKILPDEVRFVTDLKPDHIENFIDELLLRDYASASINYYPKIIKVFCKWAERRYKIPNAAREITVPKLRQPDKKFLTREQYLKLLGVCDEGVVPWIKFLAATGIRATVFCNLRWYMYSPYNKTLHIPAEFAKSKRDRIIGLNKTAISVLCNIKKLRPSSPDDLIFTQKDGNPLDRKSLYGKINRAFKRLGLSGGPHALRHYCATQLLKAGVPIIKVSKFLGHADIMTTQKHYEHLVVSDFAHITDILDL